MSLTIRRLRAADTPELQRLMNLDADDVYPPKPITDLRPAELLDLERHGLDETVALGAFEAETLRAALKCGRMPRGADPLDYGNVYRGDGVILWLLIESLTAAAELFSHVRPNLGSRIYAAPEFGDFRPMAPFHTGMLPDGRKRAVEFLTSQGFTIPGGDAWGRQIRRCFRLDISERTGPAELPEGFAIEASSERLPLKLRLLTSDGRYAGEGNLHDAEMRGRRISGATYVSWLGVNEQFRGQGLGGTVLEMLIQRAREEGANRVYLSTHNDRPAWRLYERMGFREVMRCRSYVLEDGR